MNDDLRARLRAADPARHLTDPRNLELTEAHMSSTPAPTGPNRTRLALVAAAAAVLVLAGIGVVAGLADDEPSSTATGQSPDPTTSASPDPGTTATYTLDAAAPTTGRCMAPTVEGARALDVAVEGEVVSRTGDKIVLEVARTWKSPQASRRVVLDVRRAEGAISEALPVDFEVGKRYIIAVKQGTVRLCGWTGETSPYLQQHYDTAFPGQR